MEVDGSWHNIWQWKQPAINTLTGTVEVCLEEGEGMSLHKARMELETEDDLAAGWTAVFVIANHLNSGRRWHVFTHVLKSQYNEINNSDDYSVRQNKREYLVQWEKWPDPVLVVFRIIYVVVSLQNMSHYNGGQVRHW